MSETRGLRLAAGRADSCVGQLALWAYINFSGLDLRNGTLFDLCPMLRIGSIRIGRETAVQEITQDVWEAVQSLSRGVPGRY